MVPGLRPAQGEGLPPLQRPSCMGSIRRGDLPEEGRSLHGCCLPWILATHAGHVTDHTHNSHRAHCCTHRCRTHTGAGTRVCREPAQDGHVHMHTCAHPELTQDIYACMHTHKVLTQVLHMRGHLCSHQMCVHVCVHLHKEPQQRPHLSLNKERLPGMLVSQLFSLPVQHSGLLQNLHSPLTLPSSVPPTLSLPGLLPFGLVQGTKDRP